MNNAPPVYFEIEFTREVIFKDQRGTVTHSFNVGDRIKASHDNGQYYVTCLGGIYYEEAKRV